MRDRKFRGISIYGAMIYGTGYTDFLNIYPERKGLWLWSSYSWLEVEPETLAEFTGLLDKNGVEIYESDLVKIVVNKHYWVYVIKPLDEFPSAQLYAIQLYNNLGTRIDDDGDEVYDFTISTRGKGSRKELIYERGFDVIGNIYQHPELLKERENV